jgi:three-Cys-motif partner protein
MQIPQLRNSAKRRIGETIGQLCSLIPLEIKLAGIRSKSFAGTKAIDLWYLFPAHLGINRQISASAQFDEHKAESLDRVLGTREWRGEFLARTRDSDLWGDEREILVKQADVDSVTRFMISRMKGIFKGTVLEEWLPLGRRGSHWYSLLFACANPSSAATTVAARVARAVMKRK